MKILFVSDFGVHHNPGGAQRSNDLIIKKGIEIGHNIIEYNYDSSIDLFMDDYDALISSNLEVISRQNPNLLNIISSHKNHVRLEHDMNSYLTNEQRRLLFSSCKKTIFLTEYHHKLFIKKYGDFFVNVVYVPDPIDTSIFFDFKKEREDKILYVGFMHELKGTFDFFAYAINNPDLKFVVAGWGDKIFEHLAKTIPNIEFLGGVLYSKMPEIYNRYKQFIYFPRIEEPFCRSVAEAMLCGMKTNLNDKIGCVREANRIGFDFMVKECGKADCSFWNKIK